MSSSDIQSGEISNQVHQSAAGPTNDNLLKSDGDDKEVGDEEDEDEDVDFNPFLKETHSPEASSSLSTEVDGLDGDIVQGRANTRDVADVDSLNCTHKVLNSDIGDTEHDEEETVTHTDSPELQNTIPRQYDNVKYGPLSQLGRDKENASSCFLEANYGVIGDSSNATHARMLMEHLDDDDNDAICRRTRARYSLAGFTLDELEAFLQETDDDDDIQNVDDEEEYRKFLSAVLQGGDSDNHPIQGNENVDDDDEDNDADFEIELEEALESDDDDVHMDKNQLEEQGRAAWRPATRQNRRQKASVEYEKKLLEQTKRPLRPLIPIPNGPIAPTTAFNQMTCMLDNAQSCRSNTSEEDLINGFTPHQIGQLHCLIHEHVQLLIQIFSLCVLDPSRQHIASHVQGLILEILHKRNEVTTCRSEPYPDTCFSPEYVCSSFVKEIPKTGPVQCSSESSTYTSHEVFSPNKIFLPPNIPFSRGRCENAYGWQLSWMPSIRGPKLSVLDVAPLNLVGSYLDDIHAAVREHRQHQLENSFEGQNEKKPLFPCFSSVTESDSEAVKVNCLPDANSTPSSATQQPPKKTLAAALVERTKKQSVAPVPRNVAQLAHRFAPLFNPALFPHKPPPAAVANRVLFTDSEDELLALGLMLCNSDWKAIQERFLPCKSKHQIFVRQKNRCSSKAPENPIKAVRRMKTSPLNPEEIKRIQEGLKVFKLDWMSVWRFIVPYRDPSLLPRQWRTAHGTQKSYKQDAEKKEKRRQYESQRRRRAAELAKWHGASDKEDYQPEYIGGGHCSEDNMDHEDGPYVHEAFLADWRPGTSMLGSSEQPCSNRNDQILFNNAPLQKGITGEEPNFCGSALAESKVVVQGYYSQQAYAPSHVANMQANNSTLNMTLATCKSHVHSHPCRVPESNLRIVKLAPDLPPVNLPPSVRVIPNSTLKINQFGACAMISAPGGGIMDPTTVNLDPQRQQSSEAARALAVEASRDKGNIVKEKVTDSCIAPGASRDKSIVENRYSDLELQMHPLLFEAPNGGQLSYFPLNSRSSSNSFSFLAGNQSRLNLSLFHNSHQPSSTGEHFSKTFKTKESTLASCGIDFHPLLQQSDDTNFEAVTACTTAPVTTCSEGNSVPPATSSSIPNETSGLDLEIHLTSSRDGLTYSRKPTVSSVSPENANGTRNTLSTSVSKLVSGVHAVAPDKNNHRFNVDNISDQPHPEIVMEQEELSDSDEEVEEHVEFECEEMADSEGEEGSGCEQIAEAQDTASAFMAEKVTTDVNSQHQQRELSKLDCSPDNVCFSTKSSTPFLKLGLRCQPRKEINSSSWLSLDSCAPARPSHSKSKNEGSKSDDSAARKNLGNLPNRSTKQMTPGTKRCHNTEVCGRDCRRTRARSYFCPKI